LPLDADGFFPTGDAGRLLDASAPERGLVFDGRIAENFKLTTGTWVSVGALRVQVIAACTPLVADAVVAGHDRDYVTILLFANGAPDRDLLRARLAQHNQANPGSATEIRRALVCAEAPSIDAGEITDKGYLNQRAILDRRAALIERLYAATPDDDLIIV
jgi:feruloyl-CoA synthase